jgi:hypothetical protein
VLSERIGHLTEHFKTHLKITVHAAASLLVSKRRRLLITWSLRFRTLQDRRSAWAAQ